MKHSSREINEKFGNRNDDLMQSVCDIITYSGRELSEKALE